MDEHTDFALPPGMRALDHERLAVSPDELNRLLRQQEERDRLEKLAVVPQPSETELARRAKRQIAINTKRTTLATEWRKQRFLPPNLQDLKRQQQIAEEMQRLEAEYKALQELERCEQEARWAAAAKMRPLAEGNLRAIQQRRDKGYKDHPLDLVLQGVLSELQPDEMLYMLVGHEQHWYCGLAYLIKLHKESKLPIRYVAKRHVRS
jgi:hypothetical protein